MPLKDKEKNKEYHRRYMQQWYAKDENKKQHLVLVKRNRDKHKAWWAEEKKKLHCSQCPESFWACLDFHHKDPENKERAVSDMIGRDWSRTKILEEIKKCLVVCSNCHRKIHAKQLQPGVVQ